MDIKEFTKKVDDAIAKEEIGVAIYAKHLKVILIWSGLSDDTKKEIIERIDKIVSDSNNHIKLLEKFKELYIIESKKNVY
ncbi:hypothetical protein HY745_10700 [Candidatus Desantisbacteria bacterium]|nr:hypothetical protein [Candidatus Desantisbacteria bacterium]